MVVTDNKRKASDATTDSAVASQDGQQAKRPRGEDGVAKPKPALNLSVLEKAKKALEQQKELKEKLERLKQARATTSNQPSALATGLPPGGIPGRLTARMPPPLVVDGEGKQLAAGAAASLAPEKPRENPLLAPIIESLEEQDSAHYDHFLGTKAAKSLQRRPRSTIHFVEEGKFQKQAEEVRLRAQFGRHASSKLSIPQGARDLQSVDFEPAWPW